MSQWAPGMRVTLMGLGALGRKIHPRFQRKLKHPRQHASRRRRSPGLTPDPFILWLKRLEYLLSIEHSESPLTLTFIDKLVIEIRRSCSLPT